MKRRYLLDTNICIYITKNSPESVFAHFETLAAPEVGMSIITYGELLFGAEKSQQVRQNKTVLKELVQLIEPLPLPIETATHYGQIWHFLSKKGLVIGNNDLWIASHALADNLTLVTNNLKEFSRIPHLKIENWA
jgi:tRNA(fMet)-specific endonuclease VapC